jgi:hypothetical protein
VVIRVIAIIIIAGVIIAVALLIALITAIVIPIVLLITIVATPAMPFYRLTVAIVITPAGLRPRLRTRVPTAAVLAVTARRNVQNLPGINVIRIAQTIGAGNFVRINPEFSANGVQGIAIVDGVVETTTPTTAAIAAAITRLRFALRSYS